MPEKYKYCVAGALAGILCGSLGAGGGIILLPLLLRWIKLDGKKAFATSVFIILPISAVTAGVYFWSESLDFSLSLPYLIGGLLGGAFCGKLMRKINVLWLRRIFGALLVLGGIRAVLK